MLPFAHLLAGWYGTRLHTSQVLRSSLLLVFRRTFPCSDMPLSNQTLSKVAETHFLCYGCFHSDPILSELVLHGQHQSCSSSCCLQRTLRFPPDSCSAYYVLPVPHPVLYEHSYSEYYVNYRCVVVAQCQV